MFLRWFFTVPSAIPSVELIDSVEWPLRTSRTIIRSRGDSLSAAKDSNPCSISSPRRDHTASPCGGWLITSPAQLREIALQTIGARLKGQLRSCDVAARLDPYAFGLVLWNAGPADIAPRLDALRAAAGGMDRLLEGRVASVSVRIAALPVEADDQPAALLEKIEGLLGARRRGPRGVTR